MGQAMNLAHIEREARHAHPAPSEAQKESGNYRKGHVRIHGIDVAIENARGSNREGVGADGDPWSIRMPSHYGYIKGTSGADGDQVDVYIGPHIKSPHVFVLHQLDADDGSFDEHKVFLGFASKQQVAQTYEKAFSDGRAKERMGHVSEMSVDEFKDWLKTGNHKKAIKRARGGRVFASGGAVMSDADVGIESPTISDADVGLAPPSDFKGVMGGLKEGVVNAPSEAWDLTKQRAASAYSNLNPFDAERQKNTLEGNTLDNWLKTGKGLLSAAGIPFAPVEGALRSIIGTPMAEAEHSVGTLIAPNTAAKDDRAKMIETSKENASTALSAVAPSKFSPAGARIPAAPVTAAPTMAELRAAADANYKTARGLGVELHPASLATQADTILLDLHGAGYRDYLTPKTFRAIEELKKPVGPNATIADVEGVRKALNKAAADPAEKAAANSAISAIDNYMAGLTPADAAVNPHLVGQVASELKDARGNWAAAMRSQEIAEAVKKAERQANSAGSGTNIDNAMRQRIKAILNNPKKLRGFSPEEVEQMEQIVRGTLPGNIARLIGKLSPSGVVSGALSGGAGLAAAGPIGAVALPATGYAAKKAADLITARQLARLSETARRRSPLGTASTPVPVAPTAPSAGYSPVPGIPFVAQHQNPFAALRGLFARDDAQQ